MKRMFFLVAFIVSAVACYAQDYRIQLRIGANGVVTQTWVENRNDHMECSYIPNPSAQVYYFFMPKIGVGIDYTYAPNGDVSNLSGIYDHSAIYQQYGLNAMFSTDRSRRFSIYGVIGAHRVEQAIDGEYFVSSRSGMAFSGGFGTVLKITRSFSFNIFEVRGLSYSKSFSYGSGHSSYGIIIESGFIFKMLREK